MKMYYFLLMTALFASCTGSRPVKTCDVYTEAVDPAPDSLADWSNVSQRLNVSFGNIDTRYAKSSVPAIEQTTSWQGGGWRGERLSAQVVLWSSADIAQVECAFTPFHSGKNTLDAGVAQARFVRYVLSDLSYSLSRDDPTSLSPDMLDTVSCFNLEANSVRPVWLTFDIPADAQPGVYTGALNIHARKQKTQKLNISLEVLPQTLPAAKDWKFHLDLWQHPAAVARVHNVKPWSEEHWLLLESEMKILADAGQKVITTTLNKDPWNHQCYDAYEDMILWTKNADGSWTYDYAVFDRWVELMMRLGVAKMISCYSMLPWNNELRYFDANAENYVDVSATPGSKEFIELWTPFLTDFKKHLDEKGWLNIANIAMDERSADDMKATLELLQKVAPEFGVSLAEFHKVHKQYPDIQNISLIYSRKFDASDMFDESVFAYRKENGLISTFYVSCANRFPNTFTFSEPAESAYIAWYAVASGLDGFLRWSYNSWVENPIVDSRFRTWSSGDTYIVYPGARSSIRFERLREGIQDAEKIRILREQLANDAAGLTRLNEAVARFNVLTAPPIPVCEMLHQGKKILEELSR